MAEGSLVVSNIQEKPHTSSGTRRKKPSIGTFSNVRVMSSESSSRPSPGRPPLGSLYKGSNRLNDFVGIGMKDMISEAAKAKPKFFNGKNIRHHVI